MTACFIIAPAVIAKCEIVWNLFFYISRHKTYRGVVNYATYLKKEADRWCNYGDWKAIRHMCKSMKADDESNRGAITKGSNN